MEVTVFEQDCIQIMSLQGRLDTLTAPQVQAQFEGIACPERRFFIVDLEGVEYVSSGGLRVFMTMVKKVEAMQGGIVLVNLHPFVEDLFTMTGFDSLFPTAGSLDDAARMLAEGGAA